MINKQTALEMLTDLAAGELSPADAKQLEEYRQAHPEFKSEEQLFDLSWSLSGSSANSASIPMGDVLKKELSGGGKVIQADFSEMRQLSDEEVDMIAAAGTNNPNKIDPEKTE